jgi:uncharacterized protein YndB with AHSA1/START domain
MIEVQHRIDIARPVTEVFAMLADLQQLKEWQRAVLEVRRTGDGVLRVGEEFEQTWQIMGRRRHVPSRVAAYRPDELIAFAGDAGFMDYYCGLELMPHAGQTTLAIRSEFRLHGLWRPLAPMIASEMRKETAKELETFKQIVESGRLAPAR